MDNFVNHFDFSYNSKEPDLFKTSLGISAFNLERLQVDARLAV